MAKQDVVRIKLSDIVIREWYARIAHSPSKVQEYAEIVGLLPPIEINQHNELIDGRHRYLAMKKMGFVDCDAAVTHTDNEYHYLSLTGKRNARHGFQMTGADKKKVARKLYLSCDTKEEKADCIEHCVNILSVEEQQVKRYLSDLTKEEKEEERRQMISLWLQCYTQDEIATRLEVSKMSVSREIEKVCNDLASEAKTLQTFDPHFEKYERNLYDIWSWPKLKNRVKHPGNSDERIVQNLMALYTQPNDIVIDPFGGGGSTLDVCRQHFRRCWLSDLVPIVERESEIRQMDITQALPPLDNRWSDVSLVYLDPPYWSQLRGDYSDKPTDLSNMGLDAFHDMLFDILARFAGKLSSGAKIALLIMPTQWKNEDKHVDDHMYEMRKRMDDVAGVQYKQKFSVPYPTEQYLPNMVNTAKEQGLCLVRTRELTVWEVI